MNIYKLNPLSNQHLDQEIERYQYPRNSLCACSQGNHYPKFYKQRLVFVLHGNGITQYAFCVWYSALSLNILYRRSIHIAVCYGRSLMCSILWIYYNFSILLLMDIWVVSSLGLF